jgi:hypothetical protein
MTIDSDQYDRVVKLVVDSDEAMTFEAARAILRGYRIHIRADAAACSSPGWQAAILTAVNTAVRAVHGGVVVALAADPVCSVGWGGGERLSLVLARLGAELADADEPDVPTIVFGRSECARTGRAPVIHAFAGQWTAGLSPSPTSTPAPTSTLAGGLVGALAVAEAFQWLRGHAVAGDREVRVSVWDPEGNSDGPVITDLPAELWLLGLGHLGQAYSWMLGLLPYASEASRCVVLQDDDRLRRANRATSLLHRDEHLGLHKTRLVANALEPLGWKTSLIERRYRGGAIREPRDPGVLLTGLDNVEARRRLDETGFPLIYDAGLGAGPDGYLGITVRRLPNARPSNQLWPQAAPALPTEPNAAYAALAAETGDACGVAQLAGRTVATSFVGTVAACWVVGSLLRELHGGSAFELVDHSLRNPSTVTVVKTNAAPARVSTTPAA